MHIIRKTFIFFVCLLSNSFTSPASLKEIIHITALTFFMHNPLIKEKINHYYAAFLPYCAHETKQELIHEMQKNILHNEHAQTTLLPSLKKAELRAIFSNDLNQSYVKYKKEYMRKNSNIFKRFANTICSWFSNQTFTLGDKIKEKIRIIASTLPTLRYDLIEEKELNAYLHALEKGLIDPLDLYGKDTEVYSLLQKLNLLTLIATSSQDLIEKEWLIKKALSYTSNNSLAANLLKKREEYKKDLADLQRYEIEKIKFSAHTDTMLTLQAGGKLKEDANSTDLMMDSLLRLPVPGKYTTHKELEHAYKDVLAFESFLNNEIKNGHDTAAKALFDTTSADAQLIKELNILNQEIVAFNKKPFKWSLVILPTVAIATLLYIFYPHSKKKSSVPNHSLLHIS